MTVSDFAGLDEYADGEDDPSCSFCGGEPWAMDCGDPLQCWCHGAGGHCDACGSTGLARYQVAW